VKTSPDQYFLYVEVTGIVDLYDVQAGLELAFGCNAKGGDDHSIGSNRGTGEYFITLKVKDGNA
jgi:hypothetical protein